MKSLFILLKGFFIGGTMMVPGVSGGSMALILGIYNRLISAIAAFKKDPKNNVLFLIKFLIGSILGIVLFSKYVIIPLLEIYTLQVSYFFLGAVAGGVPMIYKTAGVKRIRYSSILYPIMGIILALLISIIPEGVFAPGEKFSFWGVLIQLFGGIIIAIALILPGISVSQMLKMLGLFELFTSAVASLDILNVLPFIPLVIGALIGSLGCAKFMDMAMEKFPQPTYLIVFGFLLGSLPQLFPGMPTGWNIPICIMTFSLGFCFIYFLQMVENKKS